MLLAGRRGDQIAEDSARLDAGVSLCDGTVGGNVGVGRPGSNGVARIGLIDATGVELKKGDKIYYASSGGGGFGRLEEREAGLIERRT